MPVDVLSFREAITAGIPDHLPQPPVYDTLVNHAPQRRDLLTKAEKKLALTNALRYFPESLHAILAIEFLEELNQYGRIYMYRYRPVYSMYARPIGEYPAHSQQAAAIMLMIQNNLDPEVAQHPHELITYGGNGAVFQNWAQYLLTMQYLSQMSDEQTLVMYSGHPLGLFPSHPDAPRVVVTNGLMVPNYSSPDDYERYNALGVTQYGQMTAGSFMYIGPQGIVHGTTITLLNAARRHTNAAHDIQLYITSGLGGMSGAQPKAAVIAGMVCVVAEINPKVVDLRHRQGWVDEVYLDVNDLIIRVKQALADKTPVSIAYSGNVVDLWEAIAESELRPQLGSDQTSLHNPYGGGYYPVGYSFDASNALMRKHPELFREAVDASLRRQVDAINKVAAGGAYFWDYGNAFLLSSGRAGADVFNADGGYRYPSYVEDIMGPSYFDYGFGPFRWVCTSGSDEDLAVADQIAAKVLKLQLLDAPPEISQQLADNLKWIEEARNNQLVVGSRARILYADAAGRIALAAAFNEAIANDEITAPMVLGRDHHDVSGTDSPYRETANIYDGSRFTSDMAIQNFVGDSFRGATWVSLHNGGGVGWGESINGGFGLVIDGTGEAARRCREMLFWDVNNGIARRSWAQNSSAKFAASLAMKANQKLKITMPNSTNEQMIDSLLGNL